MLAIIALIATPIVMNIIKNTKEDSVRKSLDEILRAGETYRTTNLQDRKEECVYFDFGYEAEKGVLKEEILDVSMKYESPEYEEGQTNEEIKKYGFVNNRYATIIPISELKLKGKLPRKGYMRVCKSTGVYGNVTINGIKIEGTYGDEESKNIIKGEVPEGVTGPTIISLNTSATSKTITGVVKTKGEVKEYIWYIKGEDDKGYKEEGRSNTNVYVYKGLNRNTRYEIKVKVIDKNNLSATQTKKIKTLTVEPVEEIIKPEREKWSKEKRLTLKYNKGYKLRYGKVNEGVKEDEEGEVEIKLTEPSSITYELLDSSNYEKVYTNTVTITKIDPTVPELKAKGLVGVTTNSVTIMGACEDQESGIKAIEFGKDGKYTGRIENANWNSNVDSEGAKKFSKGYIYGGLKVGEKHKYSVRCINGAGETTGEEEGKIKIKDEEGNETEEIGTTEKQGPTIKPADNESGKEWAKKKDYIITYPYKTSEGYTNKFKVGPVDAILIKGSGKNLKEGQVIKAGVEYEATSSEIKIRFTSVGEEKSAYIYARYIEKATNEELSTNHIVTGIDSTKPVIEVEEVETKQESGWYSEYVTKVKQIVVPPSKIEKVYYKICTGSKCTSVGEEKKLATPDTTYNLGSNKERQFICYQAVSKAGVKSEIVCSNGVNVDSDNFNVPGATNITSTYDSITATYEEEATPVSGIKGYACYETNEEGEIIGSGGYNQAEKECTIKVEATKETTIKYFKKCVTNIAGKEVCSKVQMKENIGYCEAGQTITTTVDTNSGVCGTYGGCSASCGSGTQYATKTYTTKTTVTSKYEGRECSVTTGVRNQANGCSRSCNTQACCNSCSCDSNKCGSMILEATPNCQYIGNNMLLTSYTCSSKLRDDTFPWSNLFDAKNYTYWLSHGYKAANNDSYDRVGIIAKNKNDIYIKKVRIEYGTGNGKKASKNFTYKIEVNKVVSISNPNFGSGSDEFQQHCELYYYGSYNSYEENGETKWKAMRLYELEFIGDI